MWLAIWPASVLVHAQTAAPHVLTSLSQFERTISPGSILTTLAPTFDPSVFAAITAGAVEFREQSNFNASANTLTSAYFTVAPGSPTPTNLPTLPFSQIIAITTLAIDRIYVGVSPIPSVMMVGTVAGGSGTPYGTFTGAPAIFSFGYVAGTPPTISNVMETIAGVAVLYSSTATGQFTVTGSGSGGSGGSNPIAITLNGPTGPISNNLFQTVTSVVSITAVATSTNSGPLTYSWTQNPGTTPIAANGSGTPTLTMQFAVHATAVFTVTVTDSSGATATATVTVQYI
jgi:hypothetical protein